MSIKRTLLQWSATIAALTVLLASGLLVTLWLSSSGPLRIRQPLPTGLMTAWRYLVYGVLLNLWPRLVRFRLGHRNPAKSPDASRRPLAIAITAYELLLAQNGLLWLGDLLAGGGG